MQDSPGGRRSSGLSPVSSNRASSAATAHGPAWRYASATLAGMGPHCLNRWPTTSSLSPGGVEPDEGSATKQSSDACWGRSLKLGGSGRSSPCGSKARTGAPLSSMTWQPSEQSRAVMSEGTWGARSSHQSRAVMSEGMWRARSSHQSRAVMSEGMWGARSSHQSRAVMSEGMRGAISSLLY